MGFVGMFDTDDWDDDSRGGDVGSSLGWHRFADWVIDKCDELTQLLTRAKYGQSEHLDELELDCRKAMKWATTNSNRCILKNFLAILKGRRDAEVVTITGGF